MNMMRPQVRRIAGLRRVMKGKGLGALLVTKKENVHYLTGFTGSAGVALVTPGSICLVTDFRYQLQAKRETAGIPVLIQKKDLASALSEAALRYRAGTIWFDEASLTVDGLKKMRKEGLKLKGCADLVAGLRMHKDAGELARIRKAVLRAEESFKELAAFIRPGVSERELGFRLEYLMRERDARKAAFDTIVASGGNGAMPHAATTDRCIRKGDLVTFDFGAEADGYFSDITRTVCVGRPTLRQRAIHDLVFEAQQAALSMVRPGVSGKAVDQAAREVIEKAGYGKQFGHGTGHGVGLMVHEGPSVSRLSKDHLAEGMVFTIEPGVYLPGWGGVRIEDMVLVTGRGARVLTTLPRELEYLKSL